MVLKKQEKHHNFQKDNIFYKTTNVVLFFLFNIRFFANYIYMIDTKSKELLCTLARECKNGYKVIEIDDLLFAFPKLDNDYLLNMLDYLDDVGYISIKYKDNQVICLTVLPYGRQFIEQEDIEKNKMCTLKKNLIKFYLIFFFVAILGAFVGTLIYNLIF